MARILCVDDEPHVVTLKCAILEQAGHTVTASTSARDAIDKLQNNVYDAVVTDWRLGDANGTQVTYNGHLLYTYAGDSKPGDTNGEGIDGVWFVATPDLATQGPGGAAPTPTSGY